MTYNAYAKKGNLHCIFSWMMGKLLTEQSTRKLIDIDQLRSLLFVQNFAGQPF